LAGCDNGGEGGAVAAGIGSDAPDDERGYGRAERIGMAMARASFMFADVIFSMRASVAPPESG
jgi:hypothetical protein